MARFQRTPQAGDPRTVRYAVSSQKPGTRVSLAKSRLGPDHRGVWLGYVEDSFGDSLRIVWEDDPEHFEIWSKAECRYEVDRGLMRFTPPPKERRIKVPSDELMCKFPGCEAKGKARKKCPPEHKGPGALKPEFWGTEEGRNLALTPVTGSDSMSSSSDRGTLAPPTEEKDMAKTQEKLSAKQAAIQIGTDARTLRKFLRSDASTFEACGQGNRYEFTEKQISKLKKEFEAWAGKGGKKAPSRSKADAVAPEPDDDDIEDIVDEEIEIDDEEDEEEDDDLDDLEPEEDELEEIEIDEDEEDED